MCGLRATLDDWHGAIDQPIEIDEVTITCIPDLVDRLDAENHTLLALSAADGCCLLLGGGKGQYVVCRIDGQGNSSTLSSGDQTDGGTIWLCVGGQIGNYELRNICGVGEAVHAATSFLLGEMDSRFEWEPD